MRCVSFRKRIGDKRRFYLHLLNQPTNHWTFKPAKSGRPVFIVIRIENSVLNHPVLLLTPLPPAYNPDFYPAVLRRLPQAIGKVSASGGPLFFCG